MRKKKISKQIIVIGSLLLALLILAATIFVRFTNYFDSGESHAIETLRRLSGNSVVTSMDDQENIQRRQKLFSETKEKNPQAVGWLTIPGTIVDYPVMQAEDDAYYTDHSYDREEDIYGTPFLHCGNAADFTDSLSIVHGKSMRNGTMFGGLDDFLEAEFFEEVQQGLLILDDGIHTLDFFACEKKAEKADILLDTTDSYSWENAEQYRDIGISEKDKLLVLSTLDEEATVLWARIEPIV